MGIQDLTEDMLNFIPYTEEQISQFWNSFLDHIPASKTKLWKTMEHGLNHYMEVLKKRESLDRECLHLIQQNAELKFFLKKFKV